MCPYWLPCPDLQPSSSSSSSASCWSSFCRWKASLHHRLVVFIYSFGCSSSWCRCFHNICVWSRFSTKYLDNIVYIQGIDYHVLYSLNRPVMCVCVQTRACGHSRVHTRRYALHSSVTYPSILHWFRFGRCWKYCL